MDPRDYHKILVSFVLLSVLASSGALAFSAYLSNLRANQYIAGPAAGYKPDAQDRIGLIEKIPENVESSHENNPSVPESDGNLTRALARRLAGELAKQNPSGPEQGGAGFNIAIPENLEALAIEEAKKNPAVAAALFSSADKSRIKIISRYTNDDLSLYSNRLLAVIGNYYEKNPLIKNSPPSILTARALLSLVRETRERIYELSPPEPFGSYHTAILELFSLQERILALGIDDPLTAEALAIPMQTIYADQIARVREENARFQKILPDVLKTSSLPPSPFDFSLVSKAHAQAGIVTGTVIATEECAAAAAVAELAANVPASATAVPVSDAGTYAAILAEECIIPEGREWTEIILEVILGILKDMLIQELTNAMIAWITGSEYEFGSTLVNDPRFVTNWQSFLRDAFDDAAGKVIEQIAPQLCGNFGPLIRIAFSPDRNFNRYALGARCTLSDVVQNIQEFQRDFNRGGWLGFSAILANPQNTIFGAVMIASDAASQEGARAKEAEKSKALAGSGFTGTEKKICQEGTLSADGETCNGPDGEPIMFPDVQITTPGKTLSDLLSRTLSAPIDRIVNANEWEEFASILIGYVLRTAVAKLIGAGDDGLTYGYTSVTSLTDADPALLCKGLDPASLEYQTCLTNLTEGPSGVEVTTDGVCIRYPSPEVRDSLGGTPGTRTVLEERGLVFVPTVANPTKEFGISMGADRNFDKVVINIDVKIGPRNSRADAWHGLFWLQRGRSSSNYSWPHNTVGAIYLRWQPSAAIAQYSLNRYTGEGEGCGDGGTNANARFDPGSEFLLGRTYHFTYTYDTTDGLTGRLSLVVKDSSGRTVTSLSERPTANVIQSDGPAGTSGFFFKLGSNDQITNGTGVEAATYGWEYSNMRVEFTPGNGRGVLGLLKDSLPLLANISHWNPLLPRHKPELCSNKS